MERRSEFNNSYGVGGSHPGGGRLDSFHTPAYGAPVPLSFATSGSGPYGAEPGYGPSTAPFPPYDFGGGGGGGGGSGSGATPSYFGGGDGGNP